MKLDDFYEAWKIPDSDRIKAEKNILLIVPEEDTDIDWFFEQTGLDPYEVAVTWPKHRVDMIAEVSAATPQVVLQLGKRLSRRYPFIPDTSISPDIQERIDNAVTDNFVVLHHHDEYSLKDGLGTVNQLATMLKKQRRSFCCVTNHGSVGGWIKQNNACKKNGLKPIFGMEAYVSDYRGDDPELKRQHRSAAHLVLLARNETGYYNIIQIHNDAQLNGFYYSPRMDHAAAQKWGEGVIATSACMGGEIPRLLMDDKFDEAKELYEYYRDSFDEFYLELQIIEYEMQRECNHRLIKLAKEADAQMILACDSHYLDPAHAETHDLLMYIRQGKTKLDAVEKDEDVWDFDVRNLFYRNDRQMETVYRKGFVDKSKTERDPFEDTIFTEEIFKEAMANTIKVARTVDNIKLDSSVKLPKLYPDSESILREKANEGFKRLKLNKMPNKDVYVERLRYEYGVITKLGWADYFLIMEKIIAMAKSEFYDEVGEWAIGFGRGSAAGCLISWCLGLTDCDPIEHGLLFERFLDEGRPDPPDIDTDFHPGIRQRVKDRIADMFSVEKTCSIGTYSTYKTKAAITDVAKALGYDYIEAQVVTKEMESLKSFENSDGDETIVDKMEFDELVNHYPQLKAYFEKYPDVQVHAEVIRNQVKNMGKHAGGVIISDMDLRGKIPVQLESSTSGHIISSWAESGSSAELSEVGLVKYDILGLNNLPIIADCIRLVKENRGIEIKRAEIPLDDRTSIRMQMKGKLHGIFQFESPATKPIVNAVKVECLNDVSAVTSLLRPGPKDMGMHMEYAERKNGKPWESLPCLEWIFKDTYGIMVYQEQMMQISQVLCGFDGPMANKLRKACVTLDAEFVSKLRGPISLRRMLKEGYKDDFFAQRMADGSIGWARIEDVWKTGKKRVRRTRSRSGNYVDATRLHPFLTDNGWKAQQRIKDGDRLVSARLLNWDGEDELSCDFMLVVAGLLTEGCVSPNCSAFTFVNHDEEFMNMFLEAFNREFGCNGGRLSKDGKVYGIRKSAQTKLLKVIDRALSNDKVIPDIMMSSTIETMRVYLSFMLGAEGGVTVSQGTFEYCSKSEKMIRQVRTLLLRFGVRSSSGIKNDPEYGVFYRIFVNDMIEQKILLEELSIMWPSWKKEDMEKVLEGKGEANFTTDTIPQTIVERMLNQYPTIANGESGTFYTSSISRKRFLMAASKTEDTEWIQLAESDFWFDEYKDSDEVVSKHMDVYDFTVCNEYLPNMVVNGLVIHNCGKKIIELMKSIKQKFVEGAQPRIEAGEVTLEEVEELWILIVAFAKYGFNKSVDKDTKVITLDGVMRIEDIRPEQEVLCFNGKSFEPTKVVALHNHGVLPAYEVAFDDGSVETCTINHKFLTSDGQKPLRDILEFNLGVYADAKSKERLEVLDVWRDFPNEEVSCDSPQGRGTHSEGRSPDDELCVWGDSSEERMRTSSWDVSTSDRGRESESQRGSLAKHKESSKVDGGKSRIPRGFITQGAARGSKISQVEGREVFDYLQMESERSWKENRFRNGEEDFGSSRYSEETSKGIKEVENGESRGICRDNKEGPESRKAVKSRSVVAEEYFGRIGVQEKCSSEMPEHSEADGFCKEGFLDRGGRMLALRNGVHQQEVFIRQGSSERCNAEHGSTESRHYSCKTGVGLLERKRQENSQGRVAKAVGRTFEEPDSGSLAVRRVLHARFVGARQMYDLEVRHESHNFVLESGLITSNSHAITYSMITTAEIWLKHHYFLEYMTSLVLNTKRGTEKHGSNNILVRYLNYARKKGVEVFAPSVNAPVAGFHIEDGRAIRFGIAHVKNVASASDHIAKIAAVQPFTSMVDFFERCVYDTPVKTGINAGRMRETRPNNKVVESLIWAGAFDEFGERCDILSEYNIARLGIPCPTDDEIVEARDKVFKKGITSCSGINDPNADFDGIKSVGAVGAHITSIATIEPFTSMVDFHERCVFETEVKSGKNAGTIRDTRPTKKVVESLIYAGAFAELGDVRTLMREYHLLKNKTELVNIPEEELETKEIEMLGMCLSKEPLCKRYVELIREHKWYSLGRHESANRPTVFGRVMSIIPRNSQAGNPMYIVSMSDGLDSLDFFVFKAGMQYFRDSVKTGQLAAIPLDRFDDSMTRFFNDRGEISIIEEEKKNG